QTCPASIRLKRQRIRCAQLRVYVLRLLQLFYTNSLSSGGNGVEQNGREMAEVPAATTEEHFDVLTKTGEKTGVSKPRGAVHRDGDYHRAVHVWIFAESTQQLLLQKRSDCKDSWPGQWDISSAGHISAGDSSLVSARRELEEELGIRLPRDESEVSAVKYISYEEYKSLLAKEDPDYVPYDVNGQYGQLFQIITQRYKEDIEARNVSLQKQLQRYAPVSLSAELTGLTEADKEALILIMKAAKIMDDIFYLQVWESNPVLRDWLNKNVDASKLDQLKWKYYTINKGPWSCLDENQAFLTTKDSARKLIPEATKSVSGWKGLEYKAAFPILKPSGANFYPPDMDKMEFETWKNKLSQQDEATSFFTVIKRHSEGSSSSDDTTSNRSHLTEEGDLYAIPYSTEYKAFLTNASDLLRKAGDLASLPSLKRFLHSKADAFLSNDYYESDIAWMELATFEAFVGIRDDEATAQLKMFGNNLQILEQNLPMDNTYKSKDILVAPIRVIKLLYNAGDVKGPQTVAFNLPNDERIVKDRGTSMVMLKNVSEAKFKHILRPIADVCISKDQNHLVDFDSFFTHTICHECCHGIGPHSIVLPDGQKSTVRKGLLPKSLEESMYVSFLAGCFRSVRFGLEEAHGKGEALQFNWLFEKGAFKLHLDETFSVDFTKVDEAVKSLSSEILTIQAKGDKNAASLLLEKYCEMTPALKLALQKLESIQVPVDIAPTFPVAAELLKQQQ
ncbi:Nudix hydrolase 3, partial [Linum perenne]